MTRTIETITDALNLLNDFDKLEADIARKIAQLEVSERDFTNLLAAHKETLKRINKLKGALEFYAQWEIYPLAIAVCRDFEACQDGGNLARAALEATK